MYSKTEYRGLPSLIRRSLAENVWQFRDASTRRWLPATIPGCVHTDLLAAGKIEDPFFGTRELELSWIEDRDWEYRCEFVADPAFFQEEEVDLVADGLDTVATVFLNDVEIAATENMFIGHRWSVKERLRRGRNELRIHFASAMNYVRTRRTEFTPPREYCDPVGNAVRIRKQPCQFGWDWGPRLITAGVWRDLRLEAWTGNRIDHVQVRQEHQPSGHVVVHLDVELERPAASTRLKAVCRLRGAIVGSAEGRGDKVALKIEEPELWWPNGQGDQPLYEITVSGMDASGRVLNEVTKRVGLRTIRLDRSPDQWGERFQFVVNGRPVFAKGANWVPAHSFVTTLNRDSYGRDLKAAAAAHMNCIRLWGGGIYESEDFYDLCDELGLLVWHDFMFSCALYPYDDAFFASVKEEARYQVRRIHHRACLALWCGNNELAQLNVSYLKENPALMKGYVQLFHEVLPTIVEACDGVTPYWPSSEWRGVFESGHALGEKAGDSHFWDVWHARHPVKDYEKWAFRFCSEFGMQSYSSPETNATFCPPDDTNVFGPSMENHQKNRSGNRVILDYVSLRYRFPQSQDALIYLSQLNQAYCMQVGVEHYRRLTPRCMGALYWQLNDCWPVASWSSIEFTGRWKALHHAARRFFAPALVSAHVPGDESTRLGNYRESNVREVHLYTVYDRPDSADGVLVWELWRFDGTRVLAGKKKVKLHYGESVKQTSLDLSAPLKEHGRDHVYLRIALLVGAETVSEQTVFLSPPRFAALPRGSATVEVSRSNPRSFELTLQSPVFLHALAINLPGQQHQLSDNYFDLYPGVEKRITLSLEKNAGVADIRRALNVMSLVDTYH